MNYLGMRRGPIPILLMAVATGITLLVVRLATAQSPPPTPPPPFNPDAGLTRQQIEANQASSRAEFDAKYRAWLEDFIKSGTDPRGLPRVAAMAFYVEGKPSLSEAVKQASLAAVGHVTAVRFEAFAGAHVTFEIESPLKGNAARSGKSITILMGGGPFPDPQFKGGTLSYYENAPLLLPGDRALVLLEGPLASGEYAVQSFTGLYNIERGVVRGVEGNPFLSQVDGLPEAAFVANVAAAAR